MMTIKKLAIVLLTLTLSCFASAEEVDKSNPYHMIREVADITFKRFANEHVEIRKQPNILKDIIREELLPYIDYKYAAYKVLGSYLKQTTREERDAFVPIFTEYLIAAYAQVFTLYNQQLVEFEPAREIDETSKILVVRTSIIEPGRDPINIAFKVRKDKRTKEWRAFDMIAEGVSLLDSKQSELSGVIRQNGLTHVTEMLKEKATRDIVFKDEKSS